MLTDFIEYLEKQIGQPYLWGGQHTRLTPETYEAIIHAREDGRGSYKDGTTYADAAIAYCKKLFDAGAEVLYAYDCSGLGMYFIADLKHIWSDRTADGMMHGCVDLDTPEPPEMGWWTFRTDDDGKAVHIGYMVDDKHLVEAKGRKYGVVKSEWREQDWDCWGIPEIFEDEIRYPDPPEPPEPPTPPEPPVKEKFVKVVGKSVRVRKSATPLSKTIKIAHNRAWYREHGYGHRGDVFPYLGQADNGWYQIEVDGYGAAYISNKAKYTELIEL